MSDLYFPVKAIKNAQMNGYKSDRQIIVREDTGVVLGVHGPNYKLVSNEDIFPRVEEAIANSSLPADKMTTDTFVNYGGASVERRYTWRDKNSLVPISLGDPVGFQLRAVNSYDGSRSFSLFAGAIRLVCLNGMVSMQSESGHRQKHTTSLDVENIVLDIERYISSFRIECDRWSRFNSIKVTDEQAIEVISQMPNATETLVKELTLYWKDNKAEIGDNLWALYNALTYWTTHGDIRGEKAKENSNVVQFNREQRIRTVMNKPVFQELALAA